MSKYNYYFSIRINDDYSHFPYELVTRRELINKLAPYVTTMVCYTPIGGVEMTDLKKIDKIIRQIQKGTHYSLLGDNYAIRVMAQKRGDNE